MIAEEEPQYEEVSASSLEKGTTVTLILESLKQATPLFIKYLNENNLNLNEEELTQEFVVRLNRRIKILDYPFIVGQEYKDIEQGSSGKSDFYYYASEESEKSVSLFSVEAKRLPAPPPRTRESEYVRDERIKDGKRMQGGGIERYKIGAHGRGLKECGMLGYIEKEDFDYWHTKINDWIFQLAKEDSANWHNNEVLGNPLSSSYLYKYYKSIAKRIAGDEILLHHLLIKIN